MSGFRTGGILGVEAGDAAHHPTLHRTGPRQRMAWPQMPLVPRMRDPVPGAELGEFPQGPPVVRELVHGGGAEQTLWPGLIPSSWSVRRGAERGPAHSHPRDPREDDGVQSEWCSARWLFRTSDRVLIISFHLQVNNKPLLETDERPSPTGCPGRRAGLQRPCQLAAK